MKIQSKTTYQTEDGQSFNTIQEAEHHMDVLDLADEIVDQVSLPIGNEIAMELAEWLYENYILTPANQLPAQD